MNEKSSNFSDLTCLFNNGLSLVTSKYSLPRINHYWTNKFPDKRNKAPSKKLEHDVFSENCDIIVFLSDFWPIQKPDFGCIVTILLWVKVLFLPKKHWFFAKEKKKKLKISKIKRVFVRKGIFSETAYVFVFTC